MARKKVKRSTESYLTVAKGLAKYVPRLKKYKKRKTLSKYEKSSIRRAESDLKGIPLGTLHPISKKLARSKTYRGKLFLPGIRAVQLRDVPEGSTVKFRKSGDISIIEPGNQKWIYWALDRETVRSKRGMTRAGASAFAKRFPIEIVEELTKHAFKTMHVKQVQLWAHAGKVGDSFRTIQSFTRWVAEKWSQGRYMGTREIASGEIRSNPSDPGKWVNGIAILLEDPEFSKRRKALLRDDFEDEEETEE